MIINKTIDYKRCRTIKESSFQRPEHKEVEYLRSTLKTIKNDIVSLTIKQEKHCLPSFISKKKRREEIEVFKTHITSNINTLENSIKSLDFNHPILNKTIKEYFGTKLKALLTDYRNTQQSFLQKIHFFEEYEDLEEKENVLEQESKYETVVDIRQSIYELTTLLVELKMVVNFQGYNIDRIDVFYDSTNINLEGLNTELEKISVGYRGFKDKLMYGLMVFVTLLVFLTIIKILLGKHERL